jgi:hypothetical protein
MLRSNNVLESKARKPKSFKPEKPKSCTILAVKVFNHFGVSRQNLSKPGR